MVEEINDGRWWSSISGKVKTECRLPGYKQEAIKEYHYGREEEQFVT